MSEERAQETERVTRIDPAHAPRGKQLTEPEPPGEATVAAAAGLSDIWAQKQLSEQARQIAGHLRTRQQQLDYREARLNAQAARLDHEQRAFQLLVQERDERLREREQQLQQQAAELHSKLEQLKLQQRTLECREAECQQGAQQLAARERAMVQRAALLDQQTSALRREREHLEEQRRCQHEEFLQQQESLAAEEYRAAQKAAATQRRLQDWQESLAERETALEQLKEEAFSMHHEALEWRLAAEQLWQQATGGLSATETEQKFAGLRAKLSEELLPARRALQEKERLLAELAARLHQRQEELYRERRDFEAWMLRQQAALQEAAARFPRAA